VSQEHRRSILRGGEEFCSNGHKQLRMQTLRLCVLLYVRRIRHRENYSEVGDLPEGLARAKMWDRAITVMISYAICIGTSFLRKATTLTDSQHTPFLGKQNAISCQYFFLESSRNMFPASPPGMIYSSSVLVPIIGLPRFPLPWK
jgi:hypothetical protein